MELNLESESTGFSFQSPLEDAESLELKSERKRVSTTKIFEKRIKLDIGGQHFATSISTLCNYPTSLLAVMFSGKHELPTTDDGCYFIDRDGTYFKHILNFLRNPHEFQLDLLDLKRGEIELLRKDARFYGLEQQMFLRFDSLMMDTAFSVQAEASAPPSQHVIVAEVVSPYDPHHTQRVNTSSHNMSEPIYAEGDKLAVLHNTFCILFISVISNAIVPT
jgi:hypothetical protein